MKLYLQKDTKRIICGVQSAKVSGGCSSTPGLFRPYSFQNISGTSMWTKNSILCMILCTGSALHSAIKLVSILSLPLKVILVTADLSSSVKDKYSRAVRSIIREKRVLSINRNQLLCNLCTFFPACTMSGFGAVNVL